MLKLLRKYQKAIFAVVAVMIIASFSFFGTYGALQSEKFSEEDMVIGKTIDGKNLSSKDVSQMKRFLETDVYDAMNGGSANLFNDGFIRSDIMKSGLGILVFQHYKNEVWEELFKKILKFKQFKAYVHPNQFISFEGMLKQFAPYYYEDLENFRAAKEEKELFENLAKLYVDQTVFPSEMMRKMMFYVEYQYASVSPKDPALKNVDLSLFYARNMTDWFGQKFFEKIIDFVINGASFAASKGYVVTLDEAKSSLMQLGAKHLKELEGKQSITSEELNTFYRRQISMLQMSEKDALKTWQKVLLFRKMLDEVGGSVFVDSLLYKQFSEFASKGAKVEVYKLPASLKLKSEDDLKKLEIYLNGVSKIEKGDFLTEEFLPLSKIEKRAPELVEKRFLVKVASVKKEDLVRGIGMRRTWDWELDEAHWQVLQEKFPELAKCQSVDAEGRFAFLGELNEGVREKIDQFSQRQILEEEPNLVNEKLNENSLEKRILTITLGGEEEILPGVTNRKRLLDLLDQESDKLLCYTENGEDYYRIEVMDKGSIWEVLTFEEANKRGILDHMLLKKEKKESGASLYENLLPFMKKMRYRAITGDDSIIGDQDGFLSKEVLQPKSPLEKQWVLQKEEIRVTRKMGHPFFDDALFSMSEGDWSEVVMTGEGPIFYFVKETFVDTKDVGRKMEEGRELLGNEAKAAVVKDLLVKIHGS